MVITYNVCAQRFTKQVSANGWPHEILMTIAPHENPQQLCFTDIRLFDIVVLDNGLVNPSRQVALGTNVNDSYLELDMLQNSLDQFSNGVTMSCGKMVSRPYTH